MDNENEIYTLIMTASFCAMTKGFEVIIISLASAECKFLTFSNYIIEIPPFLVTFTRSYIFGQAACNG